MAPKAQERNGHRESDHTLCQARRERRPNRHQLGQEGLQPVQRHHIGPIAEGIFRIGMDLKKKTVHTHGNGRPGEGGDELPLAAAAAAAPPGLLNGVGGIENYWATEGLELGQAALIHHQSVVTKAVAAFGEPDMLRAGIVQLLHHLLHIPGG